MIDTRLALTEVLQADTNLAAYDVAIIQEHELDRDTPMPAIILAFDGSDPINESTIFSRERWNLWTIASQGDFYTVGKLGNILKARLHHKSIPATDDEAVLEFEWIWSGRAEADKALGMTVQVHRYWVLTQTNQ